jgi:hypothetical protein
MVSLSGALVFASVVDPPIEMQNGGGTLNAKGVSENQLYFQIGGAEINAFNYNLHVGFSEQLGFGMPVDGGLSIGLQRHYNSTVYTEKGWRCQWDCGERYNACPPYPQSYCPRQIPPKAHTYLSIPRQTPMGLGWDFHLGRVYKREAQVCSHAECGSFSVSGPWVYLPPDGAEHVLYFLADEGNTTLYETRDGSTMRARWFETEAMWELYLPSGQIIELAHEVTGAPFEEI